MTYWFISACRKLQLKFWKELRINPGGKFGNLGTLENLERKYCRNSGLNSGWNSGRNSNEIPEDRSHEKLSEFLTGFLLVSSGISEILWMFFHWFSRVFLISRKSMEKNPEDVWNSGRNWWKSREEFWKRFQNVLPESSREEKILKKTYKRDPSWHL